MTDATPAPLDAPLDAPLPDDPTLDEVRAALAPGIAANAAFDGWGAAARAMAADGLGVDRDVAALALPDPLGMIDAWFAHIDRAMAAAVPADTLAGMKVRDRIATQVEARLAIAAPDREALRRALAILALPANVGRAARLGWRTADLLWRRAGDTATDLNHYTKRASLLAIYAATITVFLNDDSEGQADSVAFLHRRIDGLMQVEKAKAAARARAQYRPSLSRFVGRLRYPVA
jgi:ubiquinone biosynthesis protein COQ9